MTGVGARRDINNRKIQEAGKRQQHPEKAGKAVDRRSPAARRLAALRDRKRDA